VKEEGGHGQMSRLERKLTDETQMWEKWGVGLLLDFREDQGTGTIVTSQFVIVKKVKAGSKKGRATAHPSSCIIKG
jgi:hypothetical protein